MKTIILFFALVLTAIPPWVPPSEKFVYYAKIERVIDGDTFVADLYLGLGSIRDNETIRIEGFDAWEYRKGRGGITYHRMELIWGLKAKLALEKMFKEAKYIRIMVVKKGSFGRYVGYVECDGVSVASELRKQGHERK